MPPKMPTLGPPPKKSNGGKLLGTLVVAALGIGGYRYYKHHHAALTTAPVETTTARLSPTASKPAAATPAAAAAAAPGAPAQVAANAAPAAPTSAAPAASPATAPAEAQKGPREVSFTLDGALETSLAAKVGDDVAAPLAQVLTRTLVWWVEVPNELLRGDKIDLVWETASDGEPQVDAVRLESHKFDKTFSAFRFHAAGDTYSRLYEPDGYRLEKQLVAAPLDDYEQVTSLLRDGRHHQGVDFKVDEGSKVRATFTGTITRKNWNHHNGYCLDVEESAPPHRHAYFLHLSSIPASMKVGAHVTRGEVIALSGNTGHSFAPHLHYQLMASDRVKVLDPFESQKTWRKAIDASQKAALEKEIARLSAMMAPAVASAGTR